MISRSSSFIERALFRQRRGRKKKTYRVDNTQASQCGSHLGNTKRVCLIFIKVSKGTLELFDLCWSQIGQVARDDLQSTLVNYDRPTEGQNVPGYR